MSPEECLRALDDSLLTAGTPAVLRRIVAAGSNKVNIDCPCRAVVRPYRMSENTQPTDIGQALDGAVISPSDIARAQWPGGEQPSLTVANPGFPRRGDQLIVDGRVRDIERVSPVVMAGAVVRFDLRIEG